MKTIILLSFLITTSLFAETFKEVQLEHYDCSIEIAHSKKCILYVRDLHNTTGLALIYNAQDISPEKLPEAFRLRLSSLREFNQKSIAQEFFYSRLFYYVEVIAPKDSLIF